MLLLLLACNDAPTDTGELALDVTEVLSEGEVRAGVITDEAALFGGIGAEGRVGDLKIYNDKVAFIIQGDRPGGFISTYSGTVIDADLVRDGAGRDIVMEWAPNFGYGRFVEPDSITVSANGSDGQACVRVSGDEAPFQYASAALGVETADLGLYVVTEYILEPGSYQMEVRSTITATDGEASFEPGDILSGGREIADAWEPGVGLLAPSTETSDLKGWIAHDNRVAIAIVAPDTKGSGAAALLENLFMAEMAFADEVTLADGETYVYTRHYGVGPDMDTFASGPEVSGTVTAPDGPVGGARVHVLVDDEPYSVGVTAPDGSYSVHAPDGAEIMVDGRGGRYVVDLPPGAEDYSPYTSDAIRERVLTSLTEGTDSPEPPRGRGLSSTDALLEPGTLRFDVDGPFEAQLNLQGAVAVNPRISDDYSSTRAWSADGTLDIPMEPGVYSVLVHRGLRFEVHQETIEVLAGETAEVSASLAQAYEHPGYKLSDPHLHAAPSSDGKISMEERLFTVAGTGLEVHYGTDHDHIADYNPLVDALGMDIESVVGSEVSPFQRGHINMFPLESDPTLPNGGAWIWFTDQKDSTQEQFDFLHERHPDAMIQLNHPMVLGVAGSAQWDQGSIGEPDFWSPDFELVEVLNDGAVELDFFFDITNRGIEAVPSGTSDSHTHVHNVGLSASFVKDLRGGDIVVTRGPFLDAQLDGDTLSVDSYAPSWIQVDRMHLIENGETVETVDGTSASFTLNPVEDAWYAVIAEGDTAMTPVTGETPWAMTRLFRVDVDGDGWDAPLPPLTME